MLKKHNKSSYRVRREKALVHSGVYPPGNWFAIFSPVLSPDTSSPHGPAPEASSAEATFQDWRREIESLIAAYRKDQPGASPSLVFFTATSDRTFRMDAIAQAERKLAQRAAPASLYLFQWQTPVLLIGGRLHTPHTMEINFAYDNIAKAPTLLGTGPSLQLLADKVSGAWTAFARTGNPSQKTLRWPAYDIADRPTMVFNDECKVVNDPANEARLAQLRLPTAG